jgi:hypothetical protein
MTAPHDLTVEVPSEPVPGLLRPAIEAALAGRAWLPGPEAAIAEAVARAARPIESRVTGRSS